VFITLPINILTLGLFTIIINTVLIMIVSAVIPGFDVKDFLHALLFSLVLSIVLTLIHSLY
jgi:putative membrane protein